MIFQIVHVTSQIVMWISVIALTRFYCKLGHLLSCIVKLLLAK